MALIVDLSLIVLVGVLSFGSIGRASSEVSSSRSASWKLVDYLEAVQKSPDQFIAQAQELFSHKQINLSKTDPKHSNEWQDRVAALSAMAELFALNNSTKTKEQIEKASKILTNAVLNDPSLLVRDAAVESIRRINQMQPGYASRWKSVLEKAFMSHENQSSGEGYFIRETILSAMREASISLKKEVRESAMSDQNQRVRAKIQDWSTASF